MTGLLLVDKPAGMTSHDVVDRIRRASGVRRVGHTGTLDPSATGLLILCIGKATRLSEHLTGLDKTYQGIMRLGIVTDSYDLDGKVLEEHPAPAVSAEEVQRVCEGFVGKIEQVPPMVSAVKVGGQRLYKAARKGQEVERRPRTVTVHEFRVLNCAAPDVEVRVACSSGTYVRSLCHEVGKLLGCGAVLASLRRTCVGRYDVGGATPVDEFKTPEDIRQKLLPMNDALDLPAVFLKESARTALAAGAMLVGSNLRDECPVREGWVQLKAGNGELLGLGTVQPTAAGVCIHPKRVFTG